MSFLWGVNHHRVLLEAAREYIETKCTNMDDSVDCEQILALTSAYGRRHGDDGAQELGFVVDYNTRREAEAKRLIADIQQGILKHHTIHCLSVTASFSNVTGVSIEEFGRLFADLLPDLRAKWPNCPPTAGPDEHPQFGTLRFKLFLTLFRVRRYQPYESMEVTFGWSASAIGLWCDTLLSIMDEKYQSFRAFPGNFIIINRSFVLQDNTLPCEIIHA